jgi:hypothetical protein
MKGRTAMAYIHISATRGQTIDNFRTVSAKLKAPPAVDGLLTLAAGSDENGLHVISVWQSKAHLDRWAAEQLLPAFQALGMADAVSGTEFAAYEADELYIR